MNEMPELECDPSEESVHWAIETEANARHKIDKLLNMLDYVYTFAVTGKEKPEDNEVWQQTKAIIIRTMLEHPEDYGYVVLMRSDKEFIGEILGEVWRGDFDKDKSISSVARSGLETENK